MLTFFEPRSTRKTRRALHGGEIIRVIIKASLSSMTDRFVYARASRGKVPQSNGGVGTRTKEKNDITRLMTEEEEEERRKRGKSSRAALE
jgi:hypothetical protein